MKTPPIDFSTRENHPSKKNNHLKNYPIVICPSQFEKPPTYKKTIWPPSHFVETKNRNIFVNENPGPQKLYSYSNSRHLVGRRFINWYITVLKLRFRAPHIYIYSCRYLNLLHIIDKQIVFQVVRVSGKNIFHFLFWPVFHVGCFSKSLFFHAGAFFVFFFVVGTSVFHGWASYKNKKTQKYFPGKTTLGNFLFEKTPVWNIIYFKKHAVGLSPFV